MIASATVDATSSTDYEDEGEAELENKKSSIKSDDGVRNNNNEQGSQCASDIESADELDDCLESSSTTPARELPETEATSHPSLTPTPPTPVETLDQDDTESESQEKSDGPSVVATIDFNPEAEYFSDPDLHDERPPKPCSSKDCQQDRSDDRRLISRQSEESEITAVQLELTSESENPIASRALCSSYSDLSSVQPITASDARAESFVDESTLADELASLRSEIRKISTASSSDETIASTNNTLTLDTKEVDQPEESAFVERSDNIVATHFEHEQVQPNNPEVNSQSNDDHLLKTLREYCDRLADLIREEAIKQLEEASYLLASSSSGQNSTLKHRISFLQVLEVEQVPSATMEAQNKKIYTSSMYYNDQLDSFPTIEQQVERSRTIAKQLEDVRDDEDPAQRRLVEDLALDKQDVNIALQDKRRRDSDTCSGRERASVMFKQRRERMNKYTLVSGRSLDGSNRSEARDVFRRGASVQPESYKNCASNSASSRRRQSDVLASSIVNFSLAGLDDRATLTDTEYEAPKVRRRSLPARATTTPFRERSNRHVEMDASQSQREKFRPFLDPSTLKDIERLKSWSPHVDFNEHNSVSPEVCLKLVRDLEGKKEPSRGACLFGQRQLNSADWIVESSKYDDERDETKAGRAQSAIKSTCIAATEGETSPLAELQAAPVMQISHQAQPQLETATVTSMPSFSTSSRRVIECDSPDLLTSRDDEDIDVDADAGEDGVALATANAAELAQELEPRVRSSVGRMHQSSLLDWRRPRVETPIWQVSDSGALPLGKRQQAAERQRAARSSSVAPELCSSERGFVRAGSAPRANHWQPAISAAETLAGPAFLNELGPPTERAAVLVGGPAHRQVDWRGLGGGGASAAALSHAQTGSREHHHHYNQAVGQHRCWPACCSVAQLGCQWCWRACCWPAELAACIHCLSSSHQHLTGPPAAAAAAAESWRQTTAAQTVSCAALDCRNNNNTIAAAAAAAGEQVSADSEQARQGFYRLRISIKLPRGCAQRIYISQRPSLTFARQLDTSTLAAHDF